MNSLLLLYILLLTSQTCVVELSYIVMYSLLHPVQLYSQFVFIFPSHTEDFEILQILSCFRAVYVETKSAKVITTNGSTCVQKMPAVP